MVAVIFSPSGLNTENPPVQLRWMFVESRGGLAFGLGAVG
jgi:hypothetical protein